MKIALVSEWMDGWRGGAETSTLQFVQHLLDAGVELHLFTRSRPSPTPHLHVHTISGASMSRTRQSATFAHRVDRLLQRESFDLIHAITPCRRTNLYQPRGGTVAESIERNLALRRPGAGRTVKRYSNYFNVKQRYSLALERRLLGDGAAGPVVIAISRYVARQLKEHYALPDSRIRLVYNGVDADHATAEEIAQDRVAIRGEYRIGDQDCLVLLIAHNFLLKGVRRWMEALAELNRRGVTDVRSLVIGKGDALRWHRLAADLGIETHLRFTGPTDRVAAFRHAADVLVHPTYYDPCSRVVLEAMVAGLPCVTTQWDGASEMIRDGVNGFVLDDPWDVAGLADRVMRLRDPALRRSLGGAARAVREAVSMARHAREVLAIYEELLSAVKC